MNVSAGQEKVLIVGAGAMGLVLGYELHLAGAQIAFLVKPARAAELARPQILYSYDDASLKTFADFDVIFNPDMTAAFAPNYVLVTLDGADMQLLKLSGGPEDIVALALFLASDDARFITSEIVHCDAGHPFRGWRG